MKASRTAAVILAAGESSRFGGPKLLAPLGDRSVLERVLDVVAGFDFAEVIVVLGSASEQLEAGTRWRSERRVLNPDPGAGLSSSLAIGVAAISGAADAALILLGDQPRVRADVVAALLGAIPDDAPAARPVAVPRYAGGGGANPVLVARQAWHLVHEASGDRGLGPVLLAHRELIVKVPFSGTNPDVDTRADLASLAAADRPVADVPTAAELMARGPSPARADGVSIASMPNLRVVGGHLTDAGQVVRTGLLYRSGALDTLADEDVARFTGLGIRTIYDLRSEAERHARPDRVVPGIDYMALDMTADAVIHAPGRIMASFGNPSAAHEAFGEGRGVAMFLDHYREFVTLESGRRAMGRFFRDLVDERHRPALIHCMGGKDRTGWLVASFLLRLGVPLDAVMADFLASNDHLGPMLGRFVADFERRGGDPQLIVDFMWTRPAYLEASLDEMRRGYGTVERYFRDGLGIDDATMATLVSQFLAPA